MEWVSTGPSAFLQAHSLLWLTVFVYGLAGYAVLHVLRVPSHLKYEGEQVVFSIGLGFFILSLQILIMGLFSLLQAPFILTGTGIILLLSLFLFKRWCQLVWATLSDWVKFIKTHPVSGMTLLIIMILSMIQLMGPPLGNDALAYHLAHPAEFLKQGKISYLLHTRESLWPYQTEMFFLWGLMLEGSTLAKLGHWIFYPLTCAAIYYLGLRWWNEHKAKWAMLVFGLTPVVFAQSSYAYVDNSFAYYVFMSIYALVLSWKKPNLALCCCSALFCAGALSTKYLALGLFAILCLAWLIAGRFKLKYALTFVLVTAAVSCIWYLRSWFVLGNPVYPFFYDVFKQGYDAQVGNLVGMGKGPFAGFTLLWNITLFPKVFGGEMLGPFYLMFLPWALWRSFRLKVRSEILALCAVTILFTAFIFTQSQQVRFFLAVAPLYCLFIGWAIEDFKTKCSASKVLMMGLIGVLVVIHLGIFAYRSLPQWGFVTGQQKVHDFLMEHEKSYPGNDYLFNHSKPGDKIIKIVGSRRFYDGDLDITYNSKAFRQDLKMQGRDIDSILHAYDFVWFGESAPQVDISRLSDLGFALVHRYEVRVGPKGYAYQIWEKSGV